MAVIRARGITRVCINLVADEGVLDAIIPEPYAIALANGVLQEFVSSHLISLSMVERWVQELVTSARAKQAEDEALATARNLVFSCVQTAAQAGQLQTIALNRQSYAAQLIIEHLAEYVTRRLISLNMIMQWLNEAITSVAANVGEERNEQAN